MAFLRVARAAALTSTAALTTVAYATSNNNASCRVSNASPSTSTSTTTNTSFQHHVLGRSNLDVQYQNKKLKQFSNSRLGNGLSMGSYPANKPIEDRACVSKAVIESDSAVLVAKSGEMLPGDVDELVEIFSVFDGHGGYQVADFASVRCTCC